MKKNVTMNATAAAIILALGVSAAKARPGFSTSPTFYTAPDDVFDPGSCIPVVLGKDFTAYRRPDNKSEVIAELSAGDAICALTINTSGWSQVHWRRGKGYDGYIEGLVINSNTKPF